MVFIVARDKPSKVNWTSLQLTTFFCNSFIRSSLFKLLISSFEIQTKDSLKKPCSIPTCYNDKTVADANIKPKEIKVNFSNRFKDRPKKIIIIARR